MRVLNKRFGITQLQTILIMGIVSLILFAMIAVPFYNAYKKKFTVSRLLVLYSTLVKANREYAIINGEDIGHFDINMTVNNFAERYFLPYMPISYYCKGQQNDCWNTPQYTDLKGNKKINQALYSIVMQNNTVIGFHRDTNGYISLIVDIDGKSGYNKLGKDVFLISFYDNNNKPTICAPEEYEKFNVKDGFHFGGYDKCGIPVDVYAVDELMSETFPDGCNKKAPALISGTGVGSSCLPIIKANSWTIDKKYPW